MMFATLCWFLACNESNRIESNRLICGTESNRIESFSFLPNRPSLLDDLRPRTRLLLTLSLASNYRPSSHCYGQPATTDWHCLLHVERWNGRLPWWNIYTGNI